MRFREGNGNGIVNKGRGKSPGPHVVGPGVIFLYRPSFLASVIVTGAAYCGRPQRRDKLRGAVCTDLTTVFVRIYHLTKTLYTYSAHLKVRTIGIIS